MGFASIRRSAACGISVLALGYATGALAQEIDDSEIVVTAAKREQSVRDVSGSVSAVSEATLQKLNAQSLSDYITRVPGRSEEHTSELQSLMRISYAVFCLKQKKNTHIT